MRPWFAARSASHSSGSRPGEKVTVEEVTRRDVNGWGVDAGLSWLLPLAYEPRLFAGYAYGSGDSDPDSGDDHSFRQTGIEVNEAGFGGVERFDHYGFLLEPELSNLGIVTVGAGLSLLSLELARPRLPPLPPGSPRGLLAGFAAGVRAHRREP